MPIKGLTDRSARLPVIGKIRKGGEKKQGKKGLIQGDDLETFRITSPDPSVLKAWETAFANEGGLLPDSIGIALPFPTLDQNFSSWYEEWDAKSLLRRCDGETQRIHLTARQDYSTNPLPCLGCPNGKDGCKPTGTLKVLVPAVKHFGVFELETHSKWDLITISESLAAIEAVVGTIQGIPLILKRMKRSISTPAFKDGQRRGRVEKSLLSIEVRNDLARPIMDAIEAQSMRRIEGFSANQSPAPQIDGSRTSTPRLESAQFITKEESQSLRTFLANNGITPAEAMKITGGKKAHEILADDLEDILKDLTELAESKSSIHEATAEQVNPTEQYPEFESETTAVLHESEVYA